MYKLFVMLIALFFSSLCFAEVEESYFETFYRDLSSPVMTKANPWFWGGVGLTTLASIFEDQFSDPAQEEFVDHKPIGELSSIGDYAGQMIPNAIYMVGMAAHGWLTNNKKSRQRSLLMTKATLYSGAVTTILKYTIREPRPGDSSDKTAFPSGHTATAFAFASVIGAEHEWYWGLAAYGLASLTALSRMNDNMHELHHVLGGMTIGISYGLGLHYRDQSKNELSQNMKPKIFYSLVPISIDGAIVQVSGIF